MCRDSLDGTASLSLWEVAEDGGRGRMIVDNATSRSCGVEVGGSYDGDWKAKSSMSRLLKALVRLPYKRPRWPWRRRRWLPARRDEVDVSRRASLASLAGWGAAQQAGASGTIKDEARDRVEELQRNPALALQLSEKEFKALLGVISVPRDFKTKWMENNAFLVYYSKGFDGIGRDSIEVESELEKLSATQAGMRNELWFLIDDSLRFGDVKEEEVSIKLAEFLRSVIN